jgi:hypothetical protein
VVEWLQTPFKIPADRRQLLENVSRRMSADHRLQCSELGARAIVALTDKAQFPMAGAAGFHRDAHRRIYGQIDLLESDTIDRSRRA